MRNFWHDLRYGARMLMKSPGLTLTALLTIALGIGANTAIFSVVNTVLLRPLPFTHPEQLVQVWGTNLKKGVSSNPTSYLNFSDWRSRSQSFEHMVAYSQGNAALIGDGGAPEQIEGVITSSEMFQMLGVQPALGRALSADDEKPGQTHVVVISDGLWRRRFGAEHNVIGRVMALGGDPTTIVGVMPPGVKFPLTADNLEFWVPLDATTAFNQVRGANYLRVVARLKSQTTLAQAQSEMDALAAGLAEQYPNQNTGRGIRLASLHEETTKNVRPALLVLLSAVVCVLLIACANVANLLLGRAVGRQKEIAVRMALGASRLRLVRQLLTESFLLASCGGALGLVLALWGMDLLAAWIPADVPRVQEFSLDARVLVFTTVVSLLTGLFFGLAPALAASKLDLNHSLKEGGRGSTEGGGNRARKLLVVTEIALSLVLLVGAGLLIKSFAHLLQVAPGFRPESTITMSISLPETKYKEPDDQAGFFQQLLGRISELPGIASVGIVDPLPLSNNFAQNTFSIEGRPMAAASAERLIVNTRVVSADYLKAMGIPLIKGRAFTERDDRDAPKTMLINETLAHRYFPGEDPLGKRVNISIAPNFVCEIVGIVGDVKHRNLETEAGPECYVSYLQSPNSSMSLIVRTTSADPKIAVPAVREIVSHLDKELPLANIMTMNDLLAESVAARKFNMLLLAAFASVALMMAAIGIFGVMSNSVTQRTHEVGIRMALGAQTGNVLRLIIGQGMLLVMLGIGLGLVGAIIVTRVLANLLYGVSATDPLTFIGVALLLGLVALTACYLPARRALKVDPINALRYE